MAPKTMKAVKVVSSGKAEIQDVPVPDVKDGDILVKVNCVAANRKRTRIHIELARAHESFLPALMDDKPC